MNETSFIRDMYNGSDVVSFTSETHILEAATAVDKYVSPILYIFGFPGNIMAFVVWIQPRMRHSCGSYLAGLALTDLLFLLVHAMFEVYKLWRVDLLGAPVVCQLLPVVFMAAQYLSPFLVLAVTVERFVAVCLPARRQTHCTPARARLVTCSLAVFSLALASMQGYFYVYYDKYNYCGIRSSAIHGGPISVLAIWTWVTELLVFMCVPLLILLLNVLVIKELRRLVPDQDAVAKLRLETTTCSLMIVSFYFIVTTMPVSVVYAIRYYFIPAGDSAADVNRKAKYLLAKSIIEEIGITHFACKFYMFLIAEQLFRQEFLIVIRGLICSRKNDTVGYTQHTEQTVYAEWHESEVTTPAVYSPDETII